MASVGDRYWVPHPELVFAPLSLAGTGGGVAKFVDGEGGDIQISAEQFSELPRVHDAQLKGVENVCNLEEVSQAALLHTVRTRYGMAQPHIYTRVARIVIAVNPFRSLPIYSAETMRKYVECRDSMDLPPHIFAVGQDAIMGLKSSSGNNQAVLISGESGAGKTESTKLVLSYVAEAVGSAGDGGSGGGVQDKVMQTNPVLEAFGNAMTVRNNNSSRFGKWLQMTVSDRFQVQGCSVQDYLLELTRVCRQGEKERNYHVFFQLIAAKDQLKELQIGEPKDYRYIKDAQYKAPGVDDKKCFEELQEAFASLGFSDKEQTEIFKIVAGILSLGNCDFADENDASRLEAGGHSTRAAELLGLSAPDLEKSMLVRSLVVGKDVTETGRTATQAAAARDALARLLYGRLFKLLVAKINVLLSDEGSTAGCFFGVLDIAGFESFETNSLEQLFINLSNEHLQNHFNNHVFKMELEDYKAEGISLAGCMDFQDNSDIITLIDSKGSILAMLDEELTVPRATDATYSAKVIKAHEKNPRFVKPKFAGTTFGIRHFAGEVTYSLEGFLEKNMDKPPDEAPKLFQAASNGVVKDIGDLIAADLAEAASAGGGRGGGGKKAAKTVSSNFRQSLASLVQKLGQAEPHFIRCVKPNAEKVPEKFTSKLVMDQLNCSGVFEAVRIRQSGFATRMLFKEFIGRYRHVIPKSVQARIFGKSAIPDETERAKIFVDALPATLSSLGCKDSESDMRLGKTKVFVRTRVMMAMDRARDLAMVEYVVMIQAGWRGHQARKMVKECYRVFDQVKAWQDANPFYQKPGSDNTALAKLKTVEAIGEQIAKLDMLLSKAELLPLSVPNAQKVQSVRDRMRLETEAMRMLEAAGTSIQPVEVDKALHKAKELELPATPKLEELRARSANLKFQVPLVKGITKAIESNDPEEMLEVLNLVKKQGLHQHPENWIEELGGEKLAGNLYNTMEAVKAERKQEEVREKMHQELVRNVEQDIDNQKAHLEVVDYGPSEKSALKKSGSRKSNARVTITGLTEAGQERILMALERACNHFDVPALETSLADALREGIDEENETLMRAQDCFASLETKEFVLQTLEEMKEEMQGSSPREAQSLKSMQNLIKQAEKLGVSPSDLQGPRGVMQEFVRKRTRETIKGQIFEDIAIEELALADDAFSDLSLFPNLKPAAEWKGHHARLWIFQGKTGAENMLRRAKHELKSALTKLPPSQEAVACSAFTNILSWMGDKPVPEVQRAGLAKAIVETAMLDKSLADEIYVQLMKQLTDNPSSRSMSRGWELMLILTQNSCPSSDLHEYLHVFLIKSLSSCPGEVHPVIRQCIADLNLTASPDALQPENTQTVIVSLIDFSTRKIRIEHSATLRQLGDILAQSLRISEPREFACYMLTEGISFHRLLPDTALVQSLLPKWKTLKERTGKNTTILYKRKLLRKDETLPPGDFAHARLTYQQALYDYLHYPMCHNMEPFYKIAGAVMWADRDHFRRFIDKGYMADEGTLEQVLPEDSVLNKRRSPEAAQVTEAFNQLQGTCDAEESKLMGMSRAFVAMQRLPMFGAYCWQGRQVFDIPREKQPVVNAPRTTCTVNPKGTEADYYICVDYTGLRFLAQGSGPAGQPFHRDFQFNDEAVERLITWGVSAQEGLVQFVVTSMNNVSMEREPMGILISCQAAVDIAYAVHMVKAMKDGEPF